MKKTYKGFYNLPVSIFKEGNVFIAYTPALDLSTSGKSYDEVKRRFHEMVKIFFYETTKKGTLDTILEELGWRRIKRQWAPPPVVFHELEKVTSLLPA